MVMNMFALTNKRKPTMEEVENSFGGNICRCTGYRPILSAFKSLCKDASEEILGKYPDIEDLICEENITRIAETTALMKFDEKSWQRVTNVADLMKRLEEMGDSPYMLVAGNTAKGVYKLPTPENYIDISGVEELKNHQITESKLIIGGNITLTNAIKLFQTLSTEHQEFAYLKKIAQHFDLIANVPVRNIGTLAGNLMMKHFHKEFPSDVFLTLETFGASLLLADTNGTKIIKSLPDFLEYDMKKKIIRSILLPKIVEGHKYETYKIMPRAQNAHALVNAGFLYKTTPSGTIEYSRIVFGNINPGFVHATKTEQYLVGKDLFTDQTLQGAFAILNEEINPDHVLPEPAAEFRKQLAIALFFKSVLSLSSKELSPKTRSGASVLQRPVSTGIQDYETNKSIYPLTEPISKIEALAQTSGQAQYIEDIPDHNHQLYGKLILAKAPAGSKILNIDPSEALNVKGIENFFTKDNIPGSNNFIPDAFALPPPGIPEKIFAEDIVEYYHQPVGILLGADRNVVEKSVDLVKITYELPKSPPLLHIRDILGAKRMDRVFKEGEIKSKRKGDDIKKTITGTFDIYGQAHFHMETQCCLVVPTEDGLDMFPSTQWMDLSQGAVAAMLKIQQNKINVFVRRCGGGFGAKLSRNSHITCATALAAWLTRKPVRVSLSLKENMEFIGKRFPFSVDYRVDVNAGGVIQSLSGQLYSDHSLAGNERSNMDNILKMLVSNYDSDTYDFVYYRTKTDTPGNTYTRAPGFFEAMSFMESLMDHIAYDLNMNPLDVRINNIGKEVKLIDYLGDLKEWADIDNRKVAIETYNKENRWKKKGISVVPMAYYFESFGPINVSVSIYHTDGSVKISHGGTEIGQGINTKAVQVCAYKFNIPMEKISVFPSNTVISPNSSSTGGSQTSEAVCYGVDKACDKLLERLKPFRKEDESQTWEQLIQDAYNKEFTCLSASAQYAPNAPFISPYLIYGACASEVEVDILTGQHILTRVDIIEDTGTSLSPNIDIGQVEGAFIMGLGYHTMEKIVFDKDGRQLTNNTWYYKVPGPKDIPVDFRIKFPGKNPNPKGVLQSKAIGEPPLCLSTSVPLAIRNAVASARQDSDSSKYKYFLFDGPTTVESTFMNCLNDFKQYTM